MRGCDGDAWLGTDDGFVLSLLPPLSRVQDEEVRPHGPRSRCYGGARQLADGVADEIVILTAHRGRHMVACDA